MRKRSIALALGMAFSLSAGGPAVAHVEHTYYFDDDECGGAISCSSEFVGDVIALPFRIVANVVDFIF
jgi:hypothetical protein